MSDSESSKVEKKPVAKAAVDAEQPDEAEDVPVVPPKTFAELGVPAPLCEACTEIGWKMPTQIQQDSLPYSMNGRDLIGLAQTGSGKTGAFALPILKALFEMPRPIMALVLAPTRELAYQIAQTFEGLGASRGVHVVTIVGGMDPTAQAVALARKPHIIVGTPGRVNFHLNSTKGFSLKSIKFLVMDEADRLLSLDFEEEINSILRQLPHERQTFLFSATMTAQVQKLQRASLQNPVKVEVTCQRVALLLRNLGFAAIPLHGQMPQTKRLGALNKFKGRERNILVATDVAARGLDIPDVDLVINYDIPLHKKDYIHRVGRTARAGKGGRALNLVTQYDVEAYMKTEEYIGMKLPLYPTEEDQVLALLERVAEAQRYAAMAMREQNNGMMKRKRPRRDEGDLNPDQGHDKPADRPQKKARQGGQGKRH